MSTFFFARIRVSDLLIAVGYGGAMTGAVGAGWSGRGHGHACDPVIEEFMELGCGRELFMVDGCWSDFG